MQLVECGVMSLSIWSGCSSKLSQVQSQVLLILSVQVLKLFNLVQKSQRMRVLRLIIELVVSILILVAINMSVASKWMGPKFVGRNIRDGTMSVFIHPASSDLPNVTLKSQMSQLGGLSCASSDIVSGIGIVDSGLAFNNLCPNIDNLGPCSNICSDIADLSMNSKIMETVPVLDSIFDVYVPKAKVTEQIEVWTHELLGDDQAEYLLDGLKNGFSIVDSNAVPPRTFRRNYKSTMNENKLKVEKRIQEGIENGHYIVVGDRPNNVSALGAVPKDQTDVRLIHDLSKA